MSDVTRFSGGGFGITGSPATGWTFPKTAETGAAEQIITMTVSDDAVASLKINNGISSASTYVPRIQSFGTNSAAASRHALVIEPRLGSGVDSGVVPTLLFNFFLGPTGSSAIGVRPLISFQNAGTEVTSVSAKGAWTYTVLKTDTVAETLATWKLDEDTGSSLTILNGTSTNALFLPRIQGTAGTNNTGLGLVGAKTTDTGVTSAAVMIQGQTAAGGALSVSNVLAVRNFSTTLMSVGAAGNVDISGGSAPSFLLGASGTAITQIRVYSQALDPASVAANTTAEQTFTVTGLATTDKVFVNKPSNTAGLGIVNARVSAVDTLAITFGNFTGAPIDAASETYTITAIRS